MVLLSDQFQLERLVTTTLLTCNIRFLTDTWGWSVMYVFTWTLPGVSIYILDFDILRIFSRISRLERLEPSSFKFSIWFWCFIVFLSSYLIYNGFFTFKGEKKTWRKIMCIWIGRPRSNTCYRKRKLTISKIYKLMSIPSYKSVTNKIVDN